MNNENFELLKTDHAKGKECFEGILKLLTEQQVNPPEAVASLMNVLVLVWAVEIGGSREDLMGNVGLFFDRAQALASGQGGATQ